MRKLHAIAAFAAVITGVASAGTAEATVTISTTGTSGAWSVVSNGNTSSQPTNPLAGNSTAAVNVANGGVPWSWVANSATSSWISTSSSGNDSPGYYTYVTTISASANNDTLNFRFAADDGLERTLLDGITVDMSRGTYIELTDATITGISAGTHTLAFLVYNNYPGQQNGTNPTGFRLETAVPEPATWAMMIVGFGAMGFAMRRGRDAQTRVRFA